MTSNGGCTGAVDSHIAALTRLRLKILDVAITRLDACHDDYLDAVASIHVEEENMAIEQERDLMEQKRFAAEVSRIEAQNRDMLEKKQLLDDVRQGKENQMMNPSRTILAGQIGGSPIVGSSRGVALHAADSLADHQLLHPQPVQKYLNAPHLQGRATVRRDSDKDVTQIQKLAKSVVEQDERGMRRAGGVDRFDDHQESGHHHDIIFSPIMKRDNPNLTATQLSLLSASGTGDVSAAVTGLQSPSIRIPARRTTTTTTKKQRQTPSKRLQYRMGSVAETLFSEDDAVYVDAINGKVPWPRHEYPHNEDDVVEPHQTHLHAPAAQQQPSDWLSHARHLFDRSFGQKKLAAHVDESSALLLATTKQQYHASIEQKLLLKHMTRIRWMEELGRRSVLYSEGHGRGLLELGFWCGITHRQESKGVCKDVYSLEQKNRKMARELQDMQHSLMAKTSKLREVEEERDALEDEARRVLALVEQGQHPVPMITSPQLREEVTVPDDGAAQNVIEPRPSRSEPTALPQRDRSSAKHSTAVLCSLEIVEEQEWKTRCDLHLEEALEYTHLAANVGSAALQTLHQRDQELRVATVELAEASTLLAAELNNHVETANALTNTLKKLTQLCELAEDSARSAVGTEEESARANLWSAWCSYRVQNRFMIVLREKDQELNVLKNQIDALKAEQYQHQQVFSSGLGDRHGEFPSSKEPSPEAADPTTSSSRSKSEKSFIKPEAAAPVAPLSPITPTTPTIPSAWDHSAVVAGMKSSVALSRNSSVASPVSSTSDVDGSDPTNFNVVETTTTTQRRSTTTSHSQIRASSYQSVQGSLPNRSFSTASNVSNTSAHSHASTAKPVNALPTITQMCIALEESERVRLVTAEAAARWNIQNRMPPAPSRESSPI